MPETKLKKEDFNKKFRLREARKERLVTCASCAHMFGGTKSDELALCKNPERLIPIKIARYHEPLFDEKGESQNISRETVCDGYKSRPLPPGSIVPPTLQDKQAVLLETQWRDPYHLDENCPYLIEEARIISTGGEVRGRSGGFDVVDISEWVPGEDVWDMCDLPCCESKLEVQVRDPNGYRTLVGIHPNGRDPKRWVRNNIVKHGSKSAMTFEEAETFFDLTEVVSKHNTTVDKIIAVSEYLGKRCNRLGSKSLSEATNPVSFSNMHHFWNEPMPSQNPEQFWAYDERLFDREKGLKTPLLNLEKIPEGFILCLDTKGFLRQGISAGSSYYGSHVFNYKYQESASSFWARGILKTIEDKDLISRGASHYLDIREVHFGGHSCDHMWGEFGVGFSGLASFHEQ